jgi:hypothetical protein
MKIYERIDSSALTFVAIGTGGVILFSLWQVYRERTQKLDVDESRDLLQLVGYWWAAVFSSYFPLHATCMILESSNRPVDWLVVFGSACFAFVWLILAVRTTRQWHRGRRVERS